MDEEQAEDEAARRKKSGSEIILRRLSFFSGLKQIETTAPAGASRREKLRLAARKARGRKRISPALYEKEIIFVKIASEPSG